MKNSISQLDQAYEICRKETQQWAKTFYLGTLLLPLEKRKAIWAIYVWCRRTDEIMDSVEASTKSQDELSDNLDAWEENTKLSTPQDQSTQQFLDAKNSDLAKNLP